jgi:hypothetical protein
MIPLEMPFNGHGETAWETSYFFLGAFFAAAFLAGLAGAFLTGTAFLAADLAGPAAGLP